MRSLYRRIRSSNRAVCPPSICSMTSASGGPSNATAELVLEIMVSTPSIESRHSRKGDTGTRCHLCHGPASNRQEETPMDRRLNTPWLALRIGIGLMATLAGLDKYFNLLANWEAYVSPVALQLLPVSAGTFMAVVGVIEIGVGLAILTGWTRLGAYVAGVWLLGVAANLALAGFFDVAVRDVIIAVAAFSLARLTEVRQEAAAPAFTNAGFATAR